MSSFIDKVGGAIDKGLKAVSVAGKDFLETTRLKREIGEAEKQSEGRFTRLGKMVYDMLGKGNLDESPLRQEIEQIRLLFKKVNELQAEVERIEAQSTQRTHGLALVTCAKCGGGNRLDDRFCGHCGGPIGPVVPVQKTCLSCGNTLKESASFCNKCGKPMSMAPPAGGVTGQR